MLGKVGIKELFPIQASTFNSTYSSKDLIARDLTGSGKTLAFSLPIVERLRARGELKGGAGMQMLVLEPTRELALQVAGVLESLKHREDEYKVVTVYGGQSMERQTRELANGAEFVVGTTGRILDHI